MQSEVGKKNGIERANCGFGLWSCKYVLNKGRRKNLESKYFASERLTLWPN